MAEAIPEKDHVESLVRSSAKWIDEAMKAWAESDYDKVAVVAPLGLEYLGKAVLWKENPALLLPLTNEGEASLFILATKPDLLARKPRTITLAPLLVRLDRLEKLPIDQRSRERIINVRNGAVHVGASQVSRHVLTDCLAVSKCCLVG